MLAALSGTKFGTVKVYTGRYGLGSKDTTPGQIVAVYRNMESETPKKRFTIGIVDDVTNLSLEIKENPDTTPKGTTSCKFWGLGADGTVGANKNSIKIIGDHTDMYAQGYFAYDSKKSGGLTISHLRFGDKPIKSTYYISQADFVACHNPSYVNKYDMVQDVKPGGSFLLNCLWSDEELDQHLPGQDEEVYRGQQHQLLHHRRCEASARRSAWAAASTPSCRPHSSSIANIIPKDEAIQYMKDAATKSYSKKGEKIVAMNHDAIERGANEYHKVNVPESWKNAVDEAKADVAIEGDADTVAYVKNFLNPCQRIARAMNCRFPRLSTSAWRTARLRLGSAAYEKRGIAVDVPEWNPQNCIQCNFCSYVCPHAVIRPVALTEEEAANAPAGMKYKDMTGMPGMKFAMTDFRAGLHRLRLLRTGLPGHEGREGARHEADGDPAAESGRLRTMASKIGPRSRKSSTSSRRPPSRAASSSSRCLSSPAPAQAAARPRMPSWSPSCSATECISPTQRAAPPSGAVPHRLLRTPVNEEGTWPGMGQLPV